jgi:hypothetical protein
MLTHTILQFREVTLMLYCFTVAGLICRGLTSHSLKAKKMNDREESPGRPYTLSSTFDYSTEPSCSAGTGVNVPKSPWVSWSGPALKNGVVDGLAARSLPNVKDQRLNVPKSRRVHTTPNGELSHEPCSRWPMIKRV